MSARSLRRQTNVFLIGHYTRELPNNKLPSNREVLKVLFYRIREDGLQLSSSLNQTVDEVFAIWEKARIPTRKKNKCVDKLSQLYEEWRSAQKNASTHSTADFQKTLETTFSSNLDKLFDIAHRDALKLMTNEDDKKFLLLQRQAGRVGFMAGVDKMLAEKEKRKRKRDENVEKQKKKKIEDSKLLEKTVELASSTSEEESRSQSFAEDDNSIPGPSTSGTTSTSTEKNLQESDLKVMNKSRGQKQILTPRVVSVLDKCKISDRNAVHLVSAFAEAFEQNLEELVLNRSSIQRRRRKIREEKAQEIKNRFNVMDFQGSVVHWDGKLLPSLIDEKSIERLPIIISLGDAEQILEIPPLESATGKAQATAVFEALVEWGLQDSVQACCFDTTSVNTGKFNGACILLENLLERDLLYLACRHHIFEVVIKAVFELKMQGTTGPDVAIFKRFQNSWTQINKANFESAMLDAKIKSKFEKDREEIIEYLHNMLSEQHPRDDYREFLELCLIFLGERLENYTFHRPGALHHARWMAKCIYSLKIFIFRDEFKLTNKEKNGLKSVCIFIVKLYVKAWFSAPKAIGAPNFDFEFLKKVIAYKKVDAKISEIVLKKFSAHLWYLSPEAVAFAFFDDAVTTNSKENMRKCLLQFENENTLDEEEEECEDDVVICKKFKLDLSEIKQICKGDLSQFITAQTNKFFERFNLGTNFLKKNASEWETDEEYQQSKKKVSKIRSVNDTAERGVKLITDYNNVSTKKEEQKQYLIQVVAEYRKKYPDEKKSTLTSSTSTST